MKSQREGGFLIAKIHQIAGRIFARKLKDYNIEINPAQGRIMFVLWRNEGISINELAKKTSLGKSTLTSMLDRLEAAGFIKRVPSLRDRRKIIIERTEKDRSFQDLYVQVSQVMTKLFYMDFSEDEIDKFENYLRRIFNNLVEYEKKSS
jgi:DNA-binding MarR family transcriptional regulator